MRYLPSSSFSSELCGHPANFTPNFVFVFASVFFSCVCVCICQCGLVKFSSSSLFQGALMYFCIAVVFAHIYANWKLRCCFLKRTFDGATFELKCMHCIIYTVRYFSALHCLDTQVSLERDFSWAKGTILRALLGGRYICPPVLPWEIGSWMKIPQNNGKLPEQND